LRQRFTRGSVGKSCVATFVALSIFCWLSLAQAEAPNDILVVANKAVSVDRLTAGEIRNFFLKKLLRYKKGGKVVPLNAKEGSQLRKEFRKRIIKMDAAEELRYFQDKKIKGGKALPQERSNPQKAVFSIEGALSYVYRSDFIDGLSKIVLVLKAQTKLGGRFKIIVHPTVGISILTKEDLKQLFLKRRTSWPNGKKVVPVDQNRTASVRTDFTKQIHGKTVRAVRRFWQQQVFSGQGVPPEELKSDKQVIEYVRSHPGAIGYVSWDAPIGSLTVITVE